MSALEGEGEEGEQKFKVNSEISYQNKKISECQQDVRKHYVTHWALRELIVGMTRWNLFQGHP